MLDRKRFVIIMCAIRCVECTDGNRMVLSVRIVHVLALALGVGLSCVTAYGDSDIVAAIAVATSDTTVSHCCYQLPRIYCSTIIFGVINRGQYCPIE